MWNCTNNNQQQPTTNQPIKSYPQVENIYKVIHRLAMLSTGLYTVRPFIVLSTSELSTYQQRYPHIHKRFNTSKTYTQLSYPHIHRLIHRTDTRDSLWTSSLTNSIHSANITTIYQPCNHKANSHCSLHHMTPTTLLHQRCSTLHMHKTFTHMANDRQHSRTLLNQQPMTLYFWITSLWNLHNLLNYIHKLDNKLTQHTTKTDTSTSTQTLLNISQTSN